MTPDKFLDLYGTRTGRWLANRLGLSGAGSQKLANLLSNYAWNHRAAVVSKAQPNVYTTICRMIRSEIQDHSLYGEVSDRICFW